MSHPARSSPAAAVEDFGEDLNAEVEAEYHRFAVLDDEDLELVGCIAGST
jgi:hypothetical protein